MKTCAVCKHESDGATCPKCGEASWIQSAPPVTPFRRRVPRKPLFVAPEPDSRDEGTE